MGGVSVGFEDGDEGLEGGLNGREGLTGRQSAINRAPDREPLERIEIEDADTPLEELGRETLKRQTRVYIGFGTGDEDEEGKPWDA